MLKFYYAPQNSGTRVHWALEELGVPYEKVRVHLDRGEQKTPEYLAINPNGKVPALVDGDAKVFESLAIFCTRATCPGRCPRIRRAPRWPSARSRAGSCAWPCSTAASQAATS